MYKINNTVTSFDIYEENHKSSEFLKENNLYKIETGSSGLKVLSEIFPEKQFIKVKTPPNKTTVVEFIFNEENQIYSSFNPNFFLTYFEIPVLRILEFKSVGNECFLLIKPTSRIAEDKVFITLDVNFSKENQQNSILLKEEQSKKTFPIYEKIEKSTSNEMSPETLLSMIF